MSWDIPMKNNQTNSVDLDALFAAEIDAPIAPSSEFLARVMGDADRIQSEFSSSQAESVSGNSIWQSLVAAIGGWTTVAGLATATVAGVWIGVSPPSGLDILTDTVLGESFGYSDYLPNLDSVLTEG